MYRNFNPQSLGVSGRQSELIELALTYGFEGFDLDMADFAKRAELRGLEHTTRFIDSAEIKVGGYELPVRCGGNEADFKTSLAGIAKVAEVAVAVNAKRCMVTLPPASQDHPYHDFFDLYRDRLTAVSDVLRPFEIQVGLAFQAAPHLRTGKEYQFIHQAEEILALIKAIGLPNIGLALDTWNWHLGGGSLDQLRELMVDQVVLVRLADVPENVDADDMKAQHRLLPGETGVVDTKGILQWLTNINYQGPVTPVPHPSIFSGLIRDAIVQKTCDSMDQLWEAIGLEVTKRVIGEQPREMEEDVSKESDDLNESNESEESEEESTEEVKT